MAPRLIEVGADQKDFAEDVLKMGVVLVSGFLLNEWRTGVYEPFDKTQNLLISLLLGLGVYYFVVDAYIVRFVVAQGQEGYYTVKRRYR
jgi:hypothetical protein